MGVGVSVLRLACEFYARGYFADSQAVMDMGAQTLHGEVKDILAVVDSYGLKLDSLALSADRRASVLWKSFGFKKADRIDILNELDAIFVDLNEPLTRKELASKYDLVTDFGNNEHPFNVAEAYRTMHRMCKPSGKLWVVQSLIGGNGFYNFDPSFFESLAAVNGYKILHCCLVVSTPSGDQLMLPMSMELLDMLQLRASSEISLSYVFERDPLQDKDFVFPLQSTYRFRDVSEHASTADGQRQELGSRSAEMNQYGSSAYHQILIPEMTHLGITPSRAYVPVPEDIVQQMVRIEMGSQAIKVLKNKIFEKLRIFRRST